VAVVESAPEVGREPAEFDRVYRLHHDRILRYCHWRLGDRYEAEDVTQEAFARAWRTRPALPNDAVWYSWLRVVAGNLCTDALRRRGRSEPLGDADPALVDAGLEDVTDSVDRLIVRQALGRINPRHREALLLRDDEGLTYDEIAARTGVPATTVTSLLWRARQSLRQEFKALAGMGEGLAGLPLIGWLIRRLRWGRRSAAWLASSSTAPAASSAAAGLGVGMAGVAAAVCGVVGMVGVVALGTAQLWHHHGPAATQSVSVADRATSSSLGSAGRAGAAGGGLGVEGGRVSQEAVGSGGSSGGSGGHTDGITGSATGSLGTLGSAAPAVPALGATSGLSGSASGALRQVLGTAPQVTVPQVGTPPAPTVGSGSVSASLPTSATTVPSTPAASPGACSVPGAAAEVATPATGVTGCP
jgi:RNA polymerase sigma-70 factor (ECF subfamily)